MPKMKRHKGIAKRIRLSASGKARYNKSNAGHLMSGKPGRRRRKLRKNSTLASETVAAKVRRALTA
ncbi:MAG: 50S ribosomal protein L35 [Phycisphaerae bacterium]|nr:50S ribosomal protein L35 [Phycisphaerae bacterium]